MPPQTTRPGGPGGHQRETPPPRGGGAPGEAEGEAGGGAAQRGLATPLPPREAGWPECGWGGEGGGKGYGRWSGPDRKPDRSEEPCGGQHSLNGDGKGTKGDGCKQGHTERSHQQEELARTDGAGRWEEKPTAFGHRRCHRRRGKGSQIGRGKGCDSPKTKGKSRQTGRRRWRSGRLALTTRHPPKRPPPATRARTPHRRRAVESVVGAQQRALRLGAFVEFRGLAALRNFGGWRQLDSRP